MPARGGWGFRRELMGGIVAGLLMAACTPAGRPPPDPVQTRSSSKNGDPPAVDQALLSKGRGLYGDRCQTCHQHDGKGMADAFPPLAGNPRLADAKFVVEVLKHGKSGKIVVKGHHFDDTMPPIGADFTDEQLAAVATYIRNSWDNHFGGVSVKDVKRILSGK